jgi:cytochrome c-type biogenesis protein CcmH/NrfG
MSGLVIAMLLALAVGLAILVAARLPLRHMMPVATVLLLGLAGYAWQGSPGLAGKPTQPRAAQSGQQEEALIAKRKALGERMSTATKWFVLSDSYAVRGETGDAVNALVAGLRESPNEPQLWTWLGNRLVAHAGGTLTPAATYAFRQALRLEPEGRAPSYFYGLALAESGEFEQSREVWAKLAARLPEDMVLREELIRNIALLQALIQRREEASSGGNPAQ